MSRSDFLRLFAGSTCLLIPFLLLSAIPARGEVEPIVLVDGGSTSFTHADTHQDGGQIFYYTEPICITGDIPNVRTPEFIRHKDEDGGEPVISFRRDPPGTAGVCHPERILSEIAVDQDFIYWLESSGLYRLPANATAGQPPQLVTTEVAGNPSGFNLELVQNQQNIFTFSRSSSSKLTQLFQVEKTTGTTTPLSVVSPTARDLQTEGTYVYWIEGRDLKRYKLGESKGAITIATEVETYLPEGMRVFPGNPVVITDFVYIAEKETTFIKRYNNFTETLSGILTCLGYGGHTIYDTVSSLTTDGEKIYFLRAYDMHPGGYDENNPFMRLNLVIGRFPRSGGELEILYDHESELPGVLDCSNLMVNDEYLWWQQLDQVMLLDLSQLEITFKPGDVNGDFKLDLSDAISLLGWLFLGGSRPRCLGAAEVNGDGSTDISDVSYLLSFLYLGGPAPVGGHSVCR